MSQICHCLIACFSCKSRSVFAMKVYCIVFGLVGTEVGTEVPNLPDSSRINFDYHIKLILES